jgi:hypothetical protein
MHNQSLTKRFADYRRNAATRGLDFQLTREQFDELTSQDCTYCGTMDHVGVDRIDSKAGYVEGNCQSMCSMCNRMASNFGKAAFLKQVERIHSHLALA